MQWFKSGDRHLDSVRGTGDGEEWNLEEDLEELTNGLGIKGKRTKRNPV